MTRYSRIANIALRGASQKLQRKIRDAVKKIEAADSDFHEYIQMKYKEGAYAAAVDDDIRVVFMKNGPELEVLDILDLSRYR